MHLTRNGRTPIGKFASLPITQDGLVDAVDICRIFDDSYDFWDRSGDGWAILPLITYYHGGEALAKFGSWFVQSSSPDIKAYYDKDLVSNVVRYAGPGMLDSIGLLLELGPPGILDRVFFGRTPLIQSIIDRDHDKIRVLLACGADPHRSSLMWNRIESPLSLAMYSSWAFCSFRDALYGINPHAEDIVRRELEPGRPLMDDGWRVETLSALLKLDFELEVEPPGYTIRQYSDCCSCVFNFEVMVQPYWQDILERIKKGIYVHNPCSDTWDVQPSSSQSLSISTNDSLTNMTNDSPVSQDYLLPDDQSQQSDEQSVTIETANSRLAPGREELWCIECWRHFKETGRPRSPSITETSSSDGDDSSVDEFSPFLFNT